MIPIVHENTRRGELHSSRHHNARSTFDETPSCPLDLGGHQYLGRPRTSPNEAGSRLDAENISARNIGRSRCRDHRDELVGIHVVDLIRNLALGLFRSNAPIEGFNVAEVTFKELRSGFTRGPVGHLDVCGESYQG